ncbi:uncharacterized protein K452DRAFT_104377 [Aplosporella prunicola CBS 121167]|uniref:Uncharacterized protein n=1 Tax=Aplosporella prunicola CBS 121167 TaxID=1176127 RepID=A0A6A6BPJ1_9PEZI|nr:uncharacterized protein K452DRAFT_104377 [Aplosporella prunicola CBS 121167]KAF2145986.1 hypothetical protein K452DRAFT_104377 [Aplosporella prunicola CBS 121167]
MYSYTQRIPHPSINPASRGTGPQPAHAQSNPTFRAKSKKQTKNSPTTNPNPNQGRQTVSNTPARTHSPPTQTSQTPTHPPRTKIAKYVSNQPTKSHPPAHNPCSRLHRHHYHKQPNNQLVLVLVRTEYMLLTSHAMPTRTRNHGMYGVCTRLLSTITQHHLPTYPTYTPSNQPTNQAARSACLPAPARTRTKPTKPGRPPNPPRAERASSKQQATSTHARVQRFPCVCRTGMPLEWGSQLP